MTKVYISSTYKDLREERQAAAEAVRKLRLVPIGMEDYNAADEPPLEVVRRDVRGCDLFVGIYGLRYGFIPDGEQKSITHLEYDEAGAANIPRLLFVRDDSDETVWKTSNIDRDRTQIDDFRGLVCKQHVVSFFSTPDELKAHVIGAISARRAEDERVREVPRLLPYLCDRSEQETELALALADHRARRPGRPLVCVVHGDARECHDSFVERMQKLLLPNYLGRGDGEPLPKQYDVLWPDSGGRTPPEKRMRLLLSNLGQSLCNSRLATPAQMAAAVAAQSAPVLVVTHAYEQTWADDELELLARWLRFWSEWPPAEPSRQLVVAPCVHYETGPPARGGGPAPDVRIRGQLESLKFDDLDLSGVVLPELRGIPIGEVHNWANVYGKEFCPADEVLQRARDFYEQLAAEGRGSYVPMEELARLLRLWLAGSPAER